LRLCAGKVIPDGLGFARPPGLDHRDRFTIERPVILF